MAEDRRLDSILDKISKSGIDSLSKEERSYLRKISGEPEPKLDREAIENPDLFLANRNCSWCFRISRAKMFRSFKRVCPSKYVART